MFPYQFYSAYSGDIAEVIHSWTTSDGQAAANYSPLFSFAPGTYTVCHTVSDVNGLCSDSTCISITVVPDSSNTLPCNAEFYHNGPILLNNMYQFTGVPNNGNAYHLWTFGDGASSEQEYPFHDFDTTGVFTVCHIVGVDGVCADTICNTIQVTEDIACNVDIVVSYATDGWPVFSAIGGSEIATYNWILSPYDSNGIGYNGTYFYSTQNNAYVPAGTEYVGIEGCVSVTFTNGCAWNGCANFTAPPDTANFLPCNAQFSYTGPLQPDSYQFTGVMNNSDAYHEWTFGDGTSSNLAMPIHSYASPGNYEVCHIVGIDGVCADTVCSTIYFGLYLAGTVNVGANCIDFGSVKLYSLDTLSNSVELIGQYPMDNNLCYYNFIGLTPGIYLVRAGLSDSSSYYNDYVPTYFGSQYYWFDAEPIYLTQSGDFYNISLIYGSNPGGNGTVNGSIDDGPFRLSNPELSSSMSPVLGAQVVITDLTNVPQRWVRTDNSGAFSITDLAYGTYRLMADEPGMTCLPIEFTLSEQTPGVTIDLVMGDEITGIVSYETSFVQGDVYPNPSNSLANLNIELIKPASLTMTMTSITGQVTWTKTNSFLQGKSSIQIPVRGIADGLYFLSIYSDKGQLITSRKMQVAN
jgi:PKD repeat protein